MFSHWFKLLVPPQASSDWSNCSEIQLMHPCIFNAVNFYKGPRKDEMMLHFISMCVFFLFGVQAVILNVQTCVALLVRMSEFTGFRTHFLHLTVAYV